MQVRIFNIVDHTISVFTTEVELDGTGRNHLGVFDYNEDSGLINTFRHGNRLDPFTLCESLVESGFATRHPGDPGTYGHVDYRVSEKLREQLAADEAEAEYHAEQQAAEIAAETNIPQHLVW